MLTSGAVLQNRYQVIRLLGQGGFGAVYQARDMRLGQIVALKENIGGDTRQFQQEALILANLRHPNLPRVSDHFVEPNGAQYLVMDFVEGEDLEIVLQRQGALPESQVLAWFDQILDAVAYLHSHNIIHRDIKPANIKITPAGQAVLVDFGIAKVFQPGQGTMSGARAVSPGYAAPEQYGGGTDQRSDIYSLGATLYALLTGGEPPDARALERGTATLTPPRVLNPALSAGCEQVILRAMAIQPNQRFQNVSAMSRAIKGMKVAPTLPAYQTPIPQRVSTQPYVQPVGVNVVGLASIMAVVAVVCIVLAIVGYIFVQAQLSIVAMPHASSTPTRGLVLPTVPAPPTLPPKPTDTLLASTSSAQAKNAIQTRRDTDITIQKNGDVQFAETWQFLFTGGPFTWATRGVGLDKVESVTDMQVSESGRSYQPSASGTTPGTYQIYQETGQQIIKWYFTPASNQSRTFTVQYELRGALRIYDSGDQFWWYVIESNHGYTIQNATITIHLPAQIPTDQIKAVLTTGHGNATVRDGQTVVFTASNLSDGDGLEIRVQFPHGVVTSPTPSWQR